MKKCVGFSLLLNIIVLLFLAELASPAFAATQQVNMVATPQISARVANTQLQAHEVGQQHRPPGQFQQNNQTFIGNSGSHNTIFNKGSNQSNTGNQDYNLQHNQDNSLNAANQLTNQGRKNGYLQNNQHYFGSSNSFDHAENFGYNQANTGNQGYNRGDNQDNSINGGNQIVN